MENQTRLHYADMHCDTLYRLRKNRECGLFENDFHVSIKRLAESGYFLQNFAAFVDTHEEKDAFLAARELIDIFDEEMEKNKEYIQPVRSYAELMENIGKGKTSALLTLEEGAVTEGSEDKLRYFYDRGVRMMTLTWNYENELAYPNDTVSQSINSRQGLKKRGQEFVQLMNELGMIIDVSHLSDAGVWEVLSLTKSPVAASHSNSRSICNNVRNLPDALIREISKGGGIIGVNLEPSFLGGMADSSTIVKHIRHIAEIGGFGCIGLGTDFDGIDGNPDIVNASQMNKLYAAMKSDGISEDDINKVLYKNVMNFYKDNLRK